MTQLSYDDLLDIFFATHDPTQLNRQGNDVGTQYRSAIFPQNEEQERKARAAIDRANADQGGRIVTTIEPMGEWWPAEDLSPGLLGGRRPAEPLLHRSHPAQAAEAAQELPGAGEKRGAQRLRRGARRSRSLIACAEAFVRHRRDRDARLCRRIRLVEQVEQARRGFDQIARRR